MPQGGAVGVVLYATPPWGAYHSEPRAHM